MKITPHEVVRVVKCMAHEAYLLCCFAVNKPARVIACALVQQHEIFVFIEDFLHVGLHFIRTGLVDQDRLERQMVVAIRYADIDT
jgi:hypothetical protein